MRIKAIYPGFFEALFASGPDFLTLTLACPAVTKLPTAALPPPALPHPTPCYRQGGKEQGGLKPPAEACSLILQGRHIGCHTATVPHPSPQLLVSEASFSGQASVIRPRATLPLSLSPFLSSVL